MCGMDPHSAASSLSGTSDGLTHLSSMKWLEHGEFGGVDLTRLQFCQHSQAHTGHSSSDFETTLSYSSKQSHSHPLLLFPHTFSNSRLALNSED